jgi:hypothetical protein
MRKSRINMLKKMQIRRSLSKLSSFSAEKHQCGLERVTGIENFPEPLGKQAMVLSNQWSSGSDTVEISRLMW